MGDAKDGPGDDKLPKTPLGPPVPPGEQGMLEPPREEGGPLLPGTYGPAGSSRLQPPLNVSHSVLTKGATSAGEIHAAFYEAAASLERPTNTAKAEFKGWTTGDALEQSHARWEAQAANVAAWLTKIEESLRGAKKLFQSQDVANGLGLDRASPAPRDPTVPPRSSALDGID